MMATEHHPQVALVTGAGYGLGQAIAVRLSAMGCHVYGADLFPEHLEETQRLIQSRGGVFSRYVFDVTHPHEWEEWTSFVLDGGAGLHILVNNAGGVAGQVHQDIEEVGNDDWDTVLKINLYSVFYGIRAVAPVMKAQEYGRIVNISSGAGRSHSLTGIQAYTSAKAGQIGLTRQMAAELGPHGITVNNVAPGFVRSNPTTEKQWQAMGETGQNQLVASIPVRRLGSAEDIAAVVGFLASPEAGYVTGQVVSADGGLQMF